MQFGEGVVHLLRSIAVVTEVATGRQHAVQVDYAIVLATGRWLRRVRIDGAPGAHEPLPAETVPDLMARLFPPDPAPPPGPGLAVLTDLDGHPLLSAAQEQTRRVQHDRRALHNRHDDLAARTAAFWHPTAAEALAAD